MVNFVDLPGLADTEGRDQKILDQMCDDIKQKCPRVDMFVLCFEYGKFDVSIQNMMATYENLLDKGHFMWLNMVAVVTKVSYTEDFEVISEWVDLMETWKHNLSNELC